MNPAPLIDLALAGVEPHGTVVYDSPWNALGAQIRRGMGSLIAEYPQETLEATDFTLRVAALAAIGGLIWHFAQPPQKAKKRRAQTRQDATAKTR